MLVIAFDRHNWAVSYKALPLKNMHFLYIEFLYYVRSEIGWCISTEVDKALGKSYENDSISMSQHETNGIQIDSMQFKPYSFQTSLITGC